MAVGLIQYTKNKERWHSMTKEVVKLDWDTPDGYDGVVEVVIPYLNPEQNEDLNNEGFTMDADKIDNETTKIVNEYLEKHIASDENFIYIKLKWDLYIEEWSWDYSYDENNNEYVFKLQLWFNYLGKDDDYPEHIDQTMDWLCSEHTMDITGKWDSHEWMRERLNEVWYENWVHHEDPWYCLKLMQNDILLTDVGPYSATATAKSTQEQIQTHINESWLTCYSTDDHIGDQKDIIDYCKERWGYAVKIPQKEVA